MSYRVVSGAKPWGEKREVGCGESEAESTSPYPTLAVPRASVQIPGAGAPGEFSGQQDCTLDELDQFERQLPHLA